MKIYLEMSAFVFYISVLNFQFIQKSLARKYVVHLISHRYFNLTHNGVRLVVHLQKK